MHVNDPMGSCPWRLIKWIVQTGPKLDSDLVPPGGHWVEALFRAWGRQGSDPAPPGSRGHCTYLAHPSRDQSREGTKELENQHSPSPSPPPPPPGQKAGGQQPATITLILGSLLEGPESQERRGCVFLFKNQLSKQLDIASYILVHTMLWNKQKTKCNSFIQSSKGTIAKHWEL